MAASGTRALKSALGSTEWRYFPYAVLVAAFLLLVARLPEAIFRAEFWAEDGLFYSEALARGTATILEPYAGYLVVGYRLVTYGETFLPPQFAPLTGNLVSFVVMAAVASFATSSRLPWSRGVGAFVALGIVLLPIGFELVGTLVHVVWPLTLWVALVAISREPESTEGRIAESVGLVAAGLTGLGAVLAAPLYVGASRRRIALIVGLASVQVATIALSFHTRPGGAGAEWSLVPYVWLLRSVVTPLLGADIAAALPPPAVVLIGLLVTSAAAVLFWRTPSAPRKLILLMLVAVPLLGIVAGGEPTRSLLSPVWAPRYFWLAGVAFIVLFAMNHRDRFAVALAGLLVIGVVAEFRISAAGPLGWEERSACIGGPTPCDVPVAPGEKWYVKWRPAE